MASGDSTPRCCELRGEADKCLWCREFARQRPKTLENPHVDNLASVTKDLTPDTAIPFFMKDTWEPLNCTSKTELLERFCAGANFALTGSSKNGCSESHINFNGKDKDVKVALDVGDYYSSTEQRVVSRKRPRPLTAQQLYDYLRQPVRLPASILHR